MISSIRLPWSGTDAGREEDYPSSNQTAAKARVISGWRFRLIIFLIGCQVIWMAWKRSRNPRKLWRLAAAVIGSRQDFKTTHPKIIRGQGRYYMNLHTPGWPSEAFNRSIDHALNLLSDPVPLSLFSVILAITNRCGFRCEHCVEWDRLNRPDSLATGEWLSILRKFQELGVSQVLLSGGEPLNRFRDVLRLLDEVPAGIDFWLFSNGYSLDFSKAQKLKQHGLKGIILSLDHVDPDLHDQFRGVRGAFAHAERAAHAATNAGLLLAISCCATNDFISTDQLNRFMRLCQQLGASFVQFLEPQPAGHYQDQPVALRPEKRKMLEELFYRMNFEPAYAGYPVISYPDLVKREQGCPGGGLHYLYVNAEGMLQACPFCQRPLFSALEPGLENRITALRKQGCPLSVPLEQILSASPLSIS